ncbi:MAG: acyl-CoA dehydrogenase family protein, partial [bacterium]
MDFSESEETAMIRETCRNICDDYDYEYKRNIIKNEIFPQEIWDDLSENDLIGAMIDPA